MDPAGNSSEEVAMAIKHSLIQKEVPKKLLGQTTDNGGDRDRKELAPKPTTFDVMTFTITAWPRNSDDYSGYIITCFTVRN